jgi:hypothetical protein
MHVLLFLILAMSSFIPNIPQVPDISPNGVNNGYNPHSAMILMLQWDVHSFEVGCLQSSAFIGNPSQVMADATPASPAPGLKCGHHMSLHTS